MVNKELELNGVDLIDLALERDQCLILVRKVKTNGADDTPADPATRGNPRLSDAAEVNYT
jgi:hypothetical protein